MAQDHTWRQWRHTWDESEEHHPGAIQGSQPTGKIDYVQRSRSKKQQRSAEHPHYTKHRPQNCPPEEWKRYVDEAEPSDSDDDEIEIITQKQFSEHQWSYAERYQEAMEPQMPSWIVKKLYKTTPIKRQSPI